MPTLEGIASAADLEAPRSLSVAIRKARCRSVHESSCLQCRLSSPNADLPVRLARDHLRNRADSDPEERVSKHVDARGPECRDRGSCHFLPLLEYPSLSLAGHRSV